MVEVVAGVCLCCQIWRTFHQPVDSYILRKNERIQTLGLSGLNTLGIEKGVKHIHSILIVCGLGCIVTIGPSGAFIQFHVRNSGFTAGL